MSMDFNDEFDIANSVAKVEVSLEYQKLKDSKVIKRDLSTFPEEHQKSALKKMNILAYVAKKLTGGWSKSQLDPLLDELFKDNKSDRPSARSVIRWRKKYNESGGDITSLVTQNHKMGNRELKVKGDDTFFDKALARFLDAKRPSVARAYEYYRDSIIIENEKIVSGNIPILSYDGFLKRIRKLPPYPVALARHGKFIADRWFSYKSSHIPPTRVLERVEIDHTPLDLILLDDELNVPLGRPYLTLLVDVFSGCVIGFHLSYNEPSYVSVSKAIAHAIKPKKYLSQLGIELNNDWPCQGKIENLIADNGREFWSKSLEHTCQELGINLQFNPVRRPWLKPFVERFFGLINQYLLSEIPGKTFSNIIEKEDYNPQKDAIMRFSTFVDQFHRWVIDIYHQNSDSRHMRIPAQRWRQSVNSLPPMTLDNEEIRRLDVLMGIKDERTLTTHGIKYLGLMYDSTALSDYRKAYPQPPNAPKKLIKIDPDDLSKIFVFLEEIDGYIEVPSTDRSGYVDNLSLHEHRVIQKYNREVVRGSVDSVGLAKARMAMHQAIQSEQQAFLDSTTKRKIKATSKQAKLANVSNTGTGTIKVQGEKIKGKNISEAPESLANSLDTWADDLEAF
ncbi:Mu transposase C-terminal domain-containing protein [Thalassotalea ganghwensis]